jgi:hypothetical protein
MQMQSGRLNQNRPDQSTELFRWMLKDYYPQVFANFSGEVIIDFRMPGHR